MKSIHHASYKNSSIKTIKSIIELKNFLHTVLEGAYLELYLRLSKNFILNVLSIHIKDDEKRGFFMQNIKNVYANKSFI